MDFGRRHVYGLLVTLALSRYAFLWVALRQDLAVVFDGLEAAWAFFVYTSGTLSLAALEYFVHLKPAQAPADLVAIAADIPDAVARDEVVAEALPPTWRAYPAPEALAEIGTAWVRAGTTAVLVVPSVVVLQERNFLLNPAHSDFGQVRFGRPEPFSFDPRLWKR